MNDNTCWTPTQLETSRGAINDGAVAADILVLKAEGTTIKNSDPEHVVPEQL